MFSEQEIETIVYNNDCVISLLGEHFWDMLYAIKVKFYNDYIEFLLDINNNFNYCDLMMYDSLPSLLKYNYRVRYKHNDDDTFRVQLDFVLS